MPRRSFVPIVLFVSAWAADARAEITLEWQAPDGCPTREEVLSRTERLLGNASSTPPLEASGQIVERDGAWVLELSTQLGETRGFRRMHAAKCSDLAEPAAIVVALAIDPDVLAKDAPRPAVAALPHAEPAPEPAPAATPAAIPVQRADTRVDMPARVEPSERRSRSLFHGRVGAGGALDTSTLPEPAFGGVLALAGGLGRAELEARGTLYGSQTERVRGDAGGELDLFALALTGCFRVLDAGSLSLCAGAEAARLGGKGVGVSDPSSGTVWLYSGLLGARAAHPRAGPVRGFVRLDAAALANQPRFFLENVGPVHQPPRFGARLALGAELPFP